MKIVKNKYYEYDWPVETDFQVKISLGEGQTPLLPAGKGLRQWAGIKKLWIKHEEMNPTGCFKDRESALVMTKALELGYKKVAIVSSGNAALSTAAYAQAAGIDCDVLVPKKTSLAKKQLIQLFGAKLEEINGSYEDVYRFLADRPLKNIWNVTSGQNYWRTEANKQIAKEIQKQLGRAPDLVVVPAGNGGCLAGIWRGFWELKQKLIINKIPRMIAVQIIGAAPLKTALEQNKPWVNLKTGSDSIAEGIVATESYCSPKAVEAISNSKGAVVTVSDQEIILALIVLIKKESLVVKPTAAAAFAGLKKLRLKPDLEVVVINTGGGMKMLGEIMRLLKNGVE